MTSTDRILIVACDREQRPRRILRDVRVPARWRGRFVLANGMPRAFTVSAFNKRDAEALALSAAREVLSVDELASALNYGVERY